MLSNKILPLKKIKENFNILFESTKKIRFLSEEVKNLNTEIEEISDENYALKEDIEYLKSKNILLEKDLSSIAYSISILNVVLENIIYNEEDLHNFRDKIKFHWQCFSYYKYLYKKEGIVWMM